MRFRKALIYLVSVAVMSAYGINVSAAEDEDDEDDESMEGVEEVLVTGSYIRRDNFDLPSPKSVIDQADIALSGNAEIGDVIFDQSFQLGVNANATPFEGICCGAELNDGLGTSTGWGEGADNQQGNQGTEVWANLRGLGTRATMTMMDGHRLPADTNIRGDRAGVDISGMYPSIAIGRVETILDGASALYGAEAVSGVINMVPRKDFEGFEVAVDYGQPLEDGAPNSGVSFLGGVQGDRGRAIFAMELREIDRMRFTDRPDFLIDSRNPWGRDNSPGNEFYPRSPWSQFWRDSYNIGSNPASRFRAPVRNAMGELQTPGERSDGTTPGGGFGGRQATTYRWADNISELAVATVSDPSCAYNFGSGNSDYGPPGGAPGIFGPWHGASNRWNDYQSRSSFASEELANGQLDTGPGGTFDTWQNEFGPINGQAFSHKFGATYTINDVSTHGNFLNGTIDEDRPARHCRSIDTDYQDLQAETTRRKGMAYFEYDMNENFTVRGEIVAGHVDYNTRMYAPGFNDFDTANGAFVSDTMAIAVGSNPGNPFRAFADGSHTNDWIPGLTENWDPDMNNQHDYPGQRTFSTMWLDSIHRQLDFFDQNGDGRYQYLQEPGEALIFAQDSNGDGIPDRDFDGDGVADVRMQRNPEARVLLMDMTPVLGPDGVTMIPARFNPAAGGIPLFEDVRFPGSVGDSNQSALLFAFPKNPRNTNLDWVHNDGINSWLRRTQRNDIRIRLGGEFTVADDWIVDADWIWSKGTRETNQPQEVTAELVKALRCKAGPTNDSCWNPFGTTYLMSDENGFPIGDPSITHPQPNDPGWTPPDHDYVNTEEENRLAGIVMGYDIQDLQMNIVDVVASNSSLFDLPYNDQPVGLAVGLHWRLEEEEFRPHALNQAATGGPRIPLRTSEQETAAVFAELSLPLLSSERFGELEMQLAARYTEIEAKGVFGQAGKADFDTVIPKVAIRYSPTDWLAIRGSLTEGFVTPGLYSLFGDTSVRQFQSVRDYTCDVVPDAAHCLAIGASAGGDSPLTEVANAGNAQLEPETSDLYNLGFSISLLEGDLVFDVDYTNVEFRGSIESIDATTNVSLNEAGFYDYVVAQCAATGPGGGPTLADWDNQDRLSNAQTANGLTPEEVQDLLALDPSAFAASSIYTNAADQACRNNAVANWIATDANAGAGESGFGGSVLERGRVIDGTSVPLALQYVESPWTAQGSRLTETMIYGARYGFNLPDSKFLEWMGDDKGTFMLTFSATQFLTQELTKFKSFGCDDLDRNSGGFCNNDHIYADITIDGVGNRNSQYFSPPAMELYSVLPPTPKWRANASLRWFKGPHTAQLAVRWHGRVDNVNVAWDAIVARNEQDPRDLVPSWTYNVAGDNTQAYPHFVPAYGDGTSPDQIPQSERCAYQPWPNCEIDSKAYWDATYSYRTTDVFGLSTMTLTASVRNVFDTYPEVITQFSGHEGYLDNIMGRMLMLRVNFGL